MKRPPGDWVNRAACRKADPELFHPDRGDMCSLAMAKAICADCPVSEECLEYALDNHEKHGVFGGLSQKERRPLLRKRRMAC